MWANKYFIARKELPEPAVLFQDYNQIWTPLGALYWSSASNLLVSRHPLSCIEEIVSHYCPQCCTRYTDEDANNFKGKCSKCFTCPECRCILVVNKPSTNTTSAAESFLVCSMCAWDSRNVGVVGNEHGGVDAVVHERERNNGVEIAFAALMTHVSQCASQSASNAGPARALPHHSTSSSSASASSTSTSTSNSISALNQNFQFPSNSSLIPPSSALQLPNRVDLKTKRSIRARCDVLSGKMSIVLQPKPLPLEGDSSFKTTRGKWWAKDSSAIHFIPNIVIKQLPSILHNRNRNDSSSSSSDNYLVFQVTNPTDGCVRLRFYVDQSQYFPQPPTSDSSASDSFIPFDCPVLQLSTQGVRGEGGGDGERGGGREGGGGEGLVLGTEVILQEFEDELLRDDDPTPATTSASATAAASPADGSAAAGSPDVQQLSQSHIGWRSFSKHNVAHISIPITAPIAPQQQLQQQQGGVEGGEDGEGSEESSASRPDTVFILKMMMEMRKMPTSPHTASQSATEQTAQEGEESGGDVQMFPFHICIPAKLL